METYLIIIIVLSGASLIASLIALALLFVRRGGGNGARLDSLDRALSELKIKLEGASGETARDIEQLRSALNDSLSARLDFLDKQMANRSDALNDAVIQRQLSLEKQLVDKQDGLQRSVSDKLDSVNALLLNENTKSEQRFKSFEATCAEQLRAIEAALRIMRETNESQLDAIRGVVNEKLQQTLNERLGESFKRVEERLGEVYKGLGEMQTLASGVGDLKKVLSNVKTRGTLGEIRLLAILEEVLAPEQYELNFDAGKGGNERVEFALKLPNDGKNAVYLPIDSKFPMDMYMKLEDAYDSGDADAVDAARKGLFDSIMRFGKDISDKYVNPPRTTNFAIMFLPTEGLYAEAVRLGLIEALQSKYRVNLSGPSTMAALLNSLQMGFRTLAIQKRSSEVWDILARIKKEFRSFDDVLTGTKRALDKANSDLEKLIGTRTRQIRRALDKVEELPSSDDPTLNVSPLALLDGDDGPDEPDADASVDSD